MAVIEINKLEKSFDKNKVLKGINLDLEKGSIVAVMGPNGSGKTTLLKSILGLVKPDSGSINVKEFHVHSFVLKTQSEFFKKVFTTKDGVEKKDDYFIINSSNSSIIFERGMYGLLDNMSTIIFPLLNYRKNFTFVILKQISPTMNIDFILKIYYKKIPENEVD